MAALFASIALLVGYATSIVISRSAPERRRLREMRLVAAGGPSLERVGLTERLDPRLETIASKIPKSPKEMTRLRRRLASAGIQSFGVAVSYSVAEIVLPLVFASVPLSLLVGPAAWVLAVIAGLAGYMVPGLMLSRAVTKRKRLIENGLYLFLPKR